MPSPNEIDVADPEAEAPTWTSREDFRLVRTAIRMRWPVSDVVRRRVIAEALAILRNPLTSARSKLSASRLLLDTDKVNLEQERRDELGTAADVHTLHVSGGLDLKAMTDDQLQQLIGGQ